MSFILAVYAAAGSAQFVLCLRSHQRNNGGRGDGCRKVLEQEPAVPAPEEWTPLEAAIAKLDKYHLLILDDLAYVTKDQAETSVVFELISARYER